MVGRLFTQDDDITPGAHPVAVLSYAYWTRRFAKDQGIVGKTILINEHPIIVIGVTPPGFYGLNLSNDPDARVPLMMTTVFNPLPASRLKSRRHQWLTVMALTPERRQSTGTSCDGCGLQTANRCRSTRATR